MRRRLSRVLPVFAQAFCLCLASLAVATTKKPPAKPVNLNTASSSELQSVPGIGPATAEKIIQMRKSYGAFKSIDDLLAIRGIGPKRLDKMRKYLTVGKPVTAGGPASPNASCPGCEKKKPSPDSDTPQEKP